MGNWISPVVLKVCVKRRLPLSKRERATWKYTIIPTPSMDLTGGRVRLRKVDLLAI